MILTQCKDTNDIENTQIYFHEIYENTPIYIEKSFENTQIWMFEIPPYITKRWGPVSRLTPSILIYTKNYMQYNCFIIISPQSL